MPGNNTKLNLLVLDDETEILNSLKRVFRLEFNVDTFTSGHDALQALEEKVYAVIISDMRMPEMDGATFLAAAREKAPKSIRMLLTGYADIESTVKAVNEGAIFSYISKPWNNEELKVVVNNGVNQYNLQRENDRLNKELAAANVKLEAHNQQLEQLVAKRTAALQKSNVKLKSSIVKQREMFHRLLDMIESIITATVGDDGGHTKRIAAHSRLLAQELELEKAETTRIYLAGLVHEIGKITLDDELLELPESELDNEQLHAYQSSALKGADILNKIPNLTNVATLVKHQYEKNNGQGFPDHLSGEAIPIGSRILKLVNDYDRLLLGRKFPERFSQKEAVAFLKKHSGSEYDSHLVKAYVALLDKLPTIEDINADYCLSVEQLEEGMTIAHDVRNQSGGVLLTKDTELTEALINKLKNYEKEMEVHLSIFIY